ncbi:MAG TPA: DUF4440 domain-containing protein [Saprospiraceae bacterium]|nr:DUF4440 domain-containing protein [Saprospiraceae bacterium]
MKTLPLFLFITLIGLSILCCKSEVKVETGPEEATFDKPWASNFLDSANTLFSQQFANKDSLGLTNWYWPDAELLFTNEEPITGEANIRGSWNKMLGYGFKSFTFKTTDVRGAGNLIVETGAYELKDSKDSLADRGKYIVVWENRDGVWKIIRDTGNTSMPGK